jgi:hypothetical protein
VDEPHEHDREEVVRLADDEAVLRQALERRRVLQVLHLRDDEVDHPFLPALRAVTRRALPMSL